MAENQRWYPAGVMPHPGMHVRAADPHGLDGNQRVAIVDDRFRFVAEGDFLVGGVDECFHEFLRSVQQRAVKPPSTGRVCPVM